VWENGGAGANNLRREKRAIFTFGAKQKPAGVSHDTPFRTEQEGSAMRTVPFCWRLLT